MASHAVRLEDLYGVSRLLAPITDSTKSCRSMPKRPICMRAPTSGNGSSMTLPVSAQPLTLGIVDDETGEEIHTPLPCTRCVEGEWTPRPGRTYESRLREEA